MIQRNFTPFPVLTTDRLVLRKLESADDRNNFFLRSDDEVNKYLEGFRHITIEQTREFIEKINKATANNESIFWVITLKETAEFIGTICLWNLSDEKLMAETGYTLHPSFQHKGYMREALEKVIDYGFKTMKLKAIEAHTHKDNARSIKLLLNCRFIPDTSRTSADGNPLILLVNEAPE
jgi:[ribosomal protein S5]-alanine N-acetyltransferase